MLSKTRYKRVEDRKWDGFIKRLLKRSTSLARHQRQARKFVRKDRARSPSSGRQQDTNGQRRSRRDDFEDMKSLKDGDEDMESLNNKDEDIESCRSFGTQKPSLLDTTEVEEPDEDPSSQPSVSRSSVRKGSEQEKSASQSKTPHRSVSRQLREKQPVKPSQSKLTPAAKQSKIIKPGLSQSKVIKPGARPSKLSKIDVNQNRDSKPGSLHISPQPGHGIKPGTLQPSKSTKLDASKSKDMKPGSSPSRHIRPGVSPSRTGPSGVGPIQSKLGGRQSKIMKPAQSGIFKPRASPSRSPSKMNFGASPSRAVIPGASPSRAVIPGASPSRAVIPGASPSRMVRPGKSVNWKKAKIQSQAVLAFKPRKRDIKVSDGKAGKM